MWTSSRTTTTMAGSRGRAPAADGCLRRAGVGGRGESSGKRKMCVDGGMDCVGVGVCLFGFVTSWGRCSGTEGKVLGGETARDKWG